MRGHVRWAVALVVALVLPASAEAAPRISIAPVRGDASGVVARQLAATLCGSFECVPFSRLRTRGKLDFAKVKAQRVAGIVAGTVVTRRAGGQVLELALLTRSLLPVWGRSYPLAARGALSRDSATDLATELDSRLAPATPPPSAPALAPAPPPAAVAPPAARIAPPPVPVAPPHPPPAAPPPALAAPEPPAPAPIPAPVVARPEPPPVAPPRPAAQGPARTRPLAAVEAGLTLTQRKLSYAGIPAGNTALRGFEASAIASPRVHVELFPASLLTDGVFSGIGLFGDYALSVGLKTKDPSGGAEHSTTFSRLGAGLLWRIQPVSSSRFALVPSISYQRSKFTVEPLAGAPITGLPDSNLSGVRAGVGAEIPVGGAVSILLGAGYVKWTTAEDLVGAGFFPSGSAYALEAEAGLSVALGGAFSLRLLGEYSGTSYSLTSSPGGTYQATGATDRYLGGGAMLRAAF